MKYLGIILSLSLVILNTYAKDTRFDPTRLFVKMKAGQSLPQLDAIKNVKRLFGSNYLVHTNNIELLIDELKQNKNVEFIEKNYYAGKKVLPKVQPSFDKDAFINFENLATFNDPKVGRIWSFADKKDHGISVNKSYLSPLGLPKAEIIVAVVDTGVDYNHEDLKDIMWTNVGEIPNNQVDDDNNGYVDDYYGINTIVKDELGHSTGDPMGSHPHGTHVSGTIAAKQNNGVGIAGVASNVKIMAIRSVPDSSDETDADVVESFLYAAKNGAKLINCSFGKEDNEGGMIVSETIEHIGSEYGVLVLAASGNEWGRNIDIKPKYPASFTNDNLLVISSTSNNGNMSWFSNIGPKSVDLVAPGSDIYSTIKNNRYGKMSGTSMATPTTTGVAAEVLSHFPNLTPFELKEILLKSVNKESAYSGKVKSGGRVDLFDALQTALTEIN